MLEKHKRFCDEYLIDMNASRAYRAIYPDIKSNPGSRVNASRLLDRQDVKDYIEARLDDMRAPTVASAAEVLEYLTSVLRGKAVYTDTLMTAKGPVEVKRKPDIKEQLKAAELLGKRYALYIDKVQQTGDIVIRMGEDVEEYGG